MKWVIAGTAAVLHLYVLRDVPLIQRDLAWIIAVTGGIAFALMSRGETEGQ